MEAVQERAQEARLHDYEIPRNILIEYKPFSEQNDMGKAFTCYTATQMKKNSTHFTKLHLIWKSLPSRLWLYPQLRYMEPRNRSHSGRFRVERLRGRLPFRPGDETITGTKIQCACARRCDSEPIDAVLWPII